MIGHALLQDSPHNIHILPMEIWIPLGEAGVHGNGCRQTSQDYIRRTTGIRQIDAKRKQD